MGGHKNRLTPCIISSNINLYFTLDGVGFRMYLPRTIEKTVLDISESFPVLLVTGPRQVGKTTMLKKLSGNRTYITLDDPMARELAVRDPALFLQRYEPPVLIDEIQYAPGLLPYIKMSVDASQQHGMFWLTGSQMFHMMKGVGESLAGRVGIVTLPSLSYDELVGLSSAPPFIPSINAFTSKLKSCPALKLAELYRHIYRGSMPALAINPQMNTDIFFSSYVQTYLQRDVKDLTQVGDELAFLRYLSCVAARTGQQLNYADMAKDTGISPPTAKQWMSILVSSGLVYLLEPYYNNTLKRIIKSPKIYMMDTGLCSYLTRWSSPETLEAGAMSGAIFETWVVSEIVKNYYNQGKRPPLFYYRDKDQKEIDLLVFEDNIPHPFEIKKSSNPGRDSIRHFGVLEQTGLTQGMGGVLCFCEDLIPVNAQHWFIPVRLL